MVRTQIQLTEEQSEDVKRLAAEEGISGAQFIRQAIDDAREKRKQRELRKRALEFIGCFDSGLGDLSVNHDKYAAEAYAE